MSPPGDPRIKLRSSSAKAKSPNRGFAFPRSDESSLGAPRASRDARSQDQGAAGRSSSALPLRLSVAQGELGIELSRPIDLGALVLEELDIALTGLKYPVDLSKGVKQFLSRRGVLRHTVVKVDLLRLAETWAKALHEFWGETAIVRLRVIFDQSQEAPHTVGKEMPDAVSAVGNDSGRPVAVAVSVHSEHAVLAFDLVLTSGTEPRFVVDVPRATGSLKLVQGSTALQLALKVLELGLECASGGLAEFKRRGRTIEVGGLAQAMSLAVLPHLGCRLPRIERHVVHRIESTMGCLRLTLGSTREPFPAGRRALRVAGLADFTQRADDLLAGSDTPGARAAFLESLDLAVGEPQILQELAEIDLCDGGRAESALSFLQESVLGAALSERASMGDSASDARFELLVGRALLGTGRKDAAKESLARALSLEPNGVFAAFSACQLLSLEPDAAERGRLLDQAVSRAPFLESVRWLRFQHVLKRKQWRIAVADAEQIEAAQSTTSERCAACLRLGVAFLEHEQVDFAGKWLKRALRLCPDQPEVQADLARYFVTMGEPLRAAELMQSALRLWEAALEEASEESDTDRLAPGLELMREKKMGVHFQLALLLKELGSESAQILGHLRRVDSRSNCGAAARIVEAEIYHAALRETERDQALLRIFEAAELGWIELNSYKQRIETLLLPLRQGPQSALLEFAQRVLKENSV